MKIGLLVIGSEVLNGKVTDTNTKALADFLKLHHLEIFQSMTVRDEVAAINEGLGLLFQNCDVLITSGGLGPTRDDITKQTIANYLGREVAYSAEAQKVAAHNYQKYNREFPGSEHGYCYLPQGFIALNNSTGFAPNLFTRHGHKYLFCGPGVPREFKSMLEDHFLSHVDEILDKSSFMEVILVRTRRVPEEKIFGEVDATLWDRLSEYGEVSSLPILFGVDIGVKIKATSDILLKEKKQKVLDIFQNSPIQSAIWNIGYENLEELIVKFSNEKKLTFSFAESCTGGLCSHRITNIPGASQCFLGSVVCYDEKVKMSLLKVNKSTLEKYTAESLETALEMARGLKEVLATNVSIAISGLAGPGGGTLEKPVGTVYLGVASALGENTHQYHFYGDRELLKQRFSQAALHLLYQELENIAR